MKNKIEYEIRMVDAWADGDSWVYNNSYSYGTYRTGAKDGKRAFLNALHRAGFFFQRGVWRVEFDGDVYELVHRSDGKPVFSAIPTA